MAFIPAAMAVLLGAASHAAAPPRAAGYSPGAPVDAGAAPDRVGTLVWLDADTLVIGDDAGPLTRWDLGAAARAPLPGPDRPFGLLPLAGGRWVGLSMDGAAIWGPDFATYDGHIGTSELRALGVSRDGARLYVSYIRGWSQVIDVASQRALAAGEFPNGARVWVPGPDDGMWLFDRERIALVGPDLQVRRSVPRGRPIPNGVLSLEVAVSADGAVAVTGSDGVHVWDLVAGTSRACDDRGPADQRVTSVALRADGVFAAARGDTITLFAPDCAIRDQFTYAGLGTRPMAFSPDGTRLATGHADGAVAVWPVP